MTNTDEQQVARVRALLELIGCPQVENGQGSPLFAQRSDGTSPPTPDLVAGPFHGPEDPRSFFIDVVAPSGDYIINELAGAAPSARFFKDVIVNRDSFTPADVPRDFANPLVSPVISKAIKYSKGRSDSALFGLVAYFDYLEKRGRPLIASLFYTRALSDVLGEVMFAEIEFGHSQIPSDRNSLVCSDVVWDLPLAFLLQLVVAGNTIDTARLEVTVLVNRHHRVDPVASNPVVAWARGLTL